MLNNSAHAQTAGTTKTFQLSESVQYISQLSACARSLILIDRGKTFQEADIFKMSILHGDPGLNSLERGLNYGNLKARSASPCEFFCIEV